MHCKLLCPLIKLEFTVRGTGVQGVFIIEEEGMDVQIWPYCERVFIHLSR